MSVNTTPSYLSTQRLEWCAQMSVIDEWAGREKEALPIELAIIVMFTCSDIALSDVCENKPSVFILFSLLFLSFSYYSHSIIISLHLQGV